MGNEWKNTLDELTLRGLFTLKLTHAQHKPVSYTHLDVYKRQDDNQPFPMNSATVHEVIRLSNKSVNPCLLYTSTHQISFFLYCISLDCGCKGTQNFDIRKHFTNIFLNFFTSTMIISHLRYKKNKNTKKREHFMYFLNIICILVV